MAFTLRIFICILVFSLLYTGTSLAQQVTVTSVTPNPVCAGSTITATYSYTLPDPATVVLYLNGPNTTNVPIGAVATNGGSGIVAGTIPADRATGSYTVFIRRTSNILPTPVNSPASSAFTVNARPSAPGVSNVAYCQNTTNIPPLTATGQNLIWYPGSSGGGGTTTAPTPPTSATGTTNYYVSQTVNGCEGPRAAQQVTINPPPTKPTVVSSLSYCQGANPPSLAGSVSSGSNLKWYGSANSGVGSTVAPAPSTANAGSITYYVSQTDRNGCESDRSAITVTIKAAPAAPSVTSPVVYCQGVVASPLSATGVAGSSLNWYGTSNNALGSTAPTPPTTAPGTINYSVSQTSNGCESARSTVQVTINTRPVAPATTPVNVCQNSTPVSLATGVTSGSGLRWYIASSGGTASTVAPTPPTTVVGQTTYYVSLVNNNGCESDRTALTFTVNSLPTAPTVASPFLFLCQNSVATSLTATGTNLKWYSVNTGGIALPNPVIPSTDVAGPPVAYYGSQTDANGCESGRTAISVVIGASPTATLISSGTLTCATTSVTLTAGIGTSYNFSGPGIASQNPVSGKAVATATGIYSVTVINTTTGCSSVTTTTVYSDTAIPSVAIIPSSTILTGANPSVSLTAQGTGTLLWSTGSSSPVISVTTGGIYSLTLTSPNGCTASASVPVVGSDLTINVELPQANFAAVGSVGNFVVNVFEVAGLPTSSGNVQITITAPVGYTVAFSPSLTTIQVSGGSQTAVNNVQWTQSQSLANRQLTLTMNAGAFINGGGVSRLAFSITRTTANSGSTSSITVNVASDLSLTYDGNVSNNGYARIIGGL